MDNSSMTNRRNLIQFHEHLNVIYLPSRLNGYLFLFLQQRKFLLGIFKLSYWHSLIHLINRSYKSNTRPIKRIHKVFLILISIFKLKNFYPNHKQSKKNQKWLTSTLSTQIQTFQNLIKMSSHPTGTFNINHPRKYCMNEEKFYLKMCVRIK